MAVLLFNEGQPDRSDAFLTTLQGPGYTIPIVATSYGVAGQMTRLVQSGTQVRIRIKVDGLIESHKTKNLFAETRDGDPNHVAMAGAHLDSVAEGPGINDNASGASALLEIALKFGMLRIHPVNKVRFAFWSAEEEGMVGSINYVYGLSDEELSKISLYLNLDTLGSPNYVRYLYDGDGSDTGVRD